MNKVLTGILLASIASSSMLHAAGYGVVDLEKVIENSTYLKQQNMSLQQSMKPQTSKLEQLGKELEAIQQRAQQNPNLAETEKQKMLTQYQAKLKEFNLIQQGLQATVQASIQVMNKTLDGRVKQVVEQLRKENNLDIVLNRNSALAYDPKYDLTDKMIKKVNVIK